MYHFQLVRIKEFLQYKLKRPFHNGKDIPDPFVQDFAKNVLLNQENRLLMRVEFFRCDLIDNYTLIEIEDFGAGSRKSKNKYRRISEIARHSSSTSRKCKLLFNMVRFYKPATIIELGTSLGIGTLSMALANRESTVYTLEGSLELFNWATDNFKRLNIDNVRAILGRFDDVLPMLIEQLGSVDLFFIDGNHTREATLRYFEIALKYSKPGSVLIFDDIRWSERMYSAWLDICNNTETKLAIDLFDIGIVFISDKINKQYFRIYF